MIQDHVKKRGESYIPWGLYIYAHDAARDPKSTPLTDKS